MDVFSHHVLKWKHTLCVHITGSCDQILLVCVFPCELKTDQVTAVVNIPAVHNIILFILPSGGRNLADTLPFLRRHRLLADTGFRRAAASQFIQRAVLFECCCRQLRLCKFRRIVVNHHIRFPTVLRHIRYGFIARRPFDGIRVLPLLPRSRHELIHQGCPGNCHTSAQKGCQTFLCSAFSSSSSASFCHSYFIPLLLIHRFSNSSLAELLPFFFSPPSAVSQFQLL